MSGFTTRDPREAERRLLLDTYRTFGCESSQPTFRYSLLDCVSEGFLINPLVVDARTEITTQLLSDKGYAVANTPENGEENFFQKDFEKTFFSEATNRLFCQTLLANGLRDPISHEFGKAIVFGVSQNHAAKLTQILNEQADILWPGKYQSDFAVQVTSQIADAQQFTLNFSNNNLLGSANFLDAYKTGKARVCVTVGMMTTGYDCPDILNLALMRPVFSPSDFVQIKGRGTRKHDFLEQLFDKTLKAELSFAGGKQDKTRFKFFDFFANCEYFEEKFDYDEVLKLPRIASGEGAGGGTTLGANGEYTHAGDDALRHLAEQPIGAQGMKIDRMFFESFEATVKADAALQSFVEKEQWDRAADYVATNLLDKPAEFFSLDKLRRAAGVDRRLTVREILEKIFGLIPGFRSRDELLDDEFGKFLLDQPPETLNKHADAVVALRYFFKAYATDAALRDTIEQRRFTELNVNPAFTMADFKAVPKEWRERLPGYVKDYVALDRFN